MSFQQFGRRGAAAQNRRAALYARRDHQLAHCRRDDEFSSRVYRRLRFFLVFSVAGVIWTASVWFLGLKAAERARFAAFMPVMRKKGTR